MSISAFTIPVIQKTVLHTNFESLQVQIVGCYSIDSEGYYIDGAQNLKYVELFDGIQDVQYDLNRNINLDTAKQYEYETISNRMEQSSRMLHLLEWVNMHPEDFAGSDPDFVLQRALLQKIFKTPCPSNPSYAYNKAGWRVAAFKRGGTIYLRKVLTSEDESSRNDFEFKTTAWGLEFEKFILSDFPNQEPEPNQIICPGAQFKTVLKTQIGGHSILYTAELDGVHTTDKFNLDRLDANETVGMLGRSKFVEVKTCSASLRWKKHDNFQKYTCFNWWLQATLGGISNMIIGYRDIHTGVVKYLENLPVSELYEKYSSGWCLDMGYKFLDDFLSEVKARAVREDSVYIFEFKNGDRRDNNIEILFEIPQNSSQYLLPNLVGKRV